MSENTLNEAMELVDASIYFRDLLDKTVSDASDSYEVLQNYEANKSYQLSLGYLNLSYQGYIELKRIYHQYKMQHYEIEPFFEAYDHYKFQLKQVVTNNDKNTSWLVSAYDQLIERKKEVSEFVDDFIKSAINNPNSN